MGLEKGRPLACSQCNSSIGPCGAYCSAQVDLNQPEKWTGPHRSNSTNSQEKTCLIGRFPVAPSDASHAACLPGLTIFHDLLVNHTQHRETRPLYIESFRTHAPAFSIANGLHCLHSRGNQDCTCVHSERVHVGKEMREISELFLAFVGAGNGARKPFSKTSGWYLSCCVSLAHSVRTSLKAMSPAAYSLSIVLAKGHLSSMLITLLFL